MYNVTHFATEFIKQGQATIAPRLTMIQFMLIMFFFGLGNMLLGLPMWTAPIFIILGYIAGYYHNGEVFYKRAVAYGRVWLRQQMGNPATLTLQSPWDEAQMKADRSSTSL